MKRLHELHPILGVSLAGFGAGILALLALILLVIAALMLFNIVFTMVSALAEAKAAGEELPMGWQSISAALGDSLFNFARVLWEARLGLIAAGFLGLLAAWGYYVGARIDPHWAWPASALAMGSVVVFTTTTWVFAQWPKIAEWLAQSPELYYTRDLFSGSLGEDLIVSLLFGLLAAVPMWMLWQQAFQGMVRSLPSDQAQPAPSAEHATSDFRNYTERLHQLKRGAEPNERAEPSPREATPARQGSSWAVLAAGLMLLLLLLASSTWMVRKAYDRVAIRLEHQTLYLRATNQPEVSQLLQIDKDTRDLSIVNIDGAGSVNITLTGGPQCSEVIRPQEQWIFVRSEGEYLHSTLSLAGLAPGEYCLELRQEEGWGMYEYTLSHGGGEISHRLALGVGLLAAMTVVSAVGLLALVLLRLGIIMPKGHRQ